MRRFVIVAAVAAMALSLFAAPVNAGSDNGKQHAVGAFRSLGTGGAVLAFGAASPAQPQANDNWDSVRIFAYAGSQSEGQVYCGDVWNVIVTVNFVPVRAWFEGDVATHWIDDGDPEVATLKTAARWSSTLGVWVQAHGSLVPPGTLSNGSHTVTQTLENPFWGVWAPDPVSIEVDNSTC